MTPPNPLLAKRIPLGPSGQHSMPQIQLGLYMMSKGDTTRAVAGALRAGYRGFDSAQWYFNEAEAGKAILAFTARPDTNGGVRREDVHFTSKLRDNSSSYDEVRRQIRKSVDRSGLGSLDLFLLHSPYGGREERLTSWRALEDAVLEGEVRMAGVSNFGVRHVSIWCPGWLLAVVLGLTKEWEMGVDGF
jgi:diketogulonate reductase-like aldo/keto reductase